jgi:hypothetical protein
MGVENISPRRPSRDGTGDPGVHFRIVVDWFEPLPVWVDIFVADELPQGLLRSN